MKSEACQTLRLAEYIDGELSGVERLQVSRHLQQCAACAEDAKALRRVGDLLRHAAALDPAPAGLDGLAGGVISRTGAERAQSWRAVFQRAVEDWHWFFVGFGSVAASFVSVAFVSAVLHFGPAPQRDDSVSALLSNRDWHVNSQVGGSLYVWATPMPEGEMRIVLTARERAAAVEAAAHPSPALAGLTTDQDFVGALGEALTRSGEPINVQAMDARVRRHAGALIDKLKDASQQYSPAGSSVYRMQLVTNTEVSGKSY
jgi:hypothetical protein